MRGLSRIGGGISNHELIDINAHASKLQPDLPYITYLKPVLPLCGGNSHIKRKGVLVANFEKNP